MSDFGFKRSSDKKLKIKRSSIENKFSIVQIPKNSNRKESILDKIDENIKKNEPSQRVKNFLKVCNKSKLSEPWKIRGQALIFLNQLGRKLLVKQQHPLKKKTIVNVSLENNKMENTSSRFSSSSEEETKVAPPTINVMMSPIKTRKQIISPNLN